METPDFNSMSTEELRKVRHEHPEPAVRQKAKEAEIQRGVQHGQIDWRKTERERLIIP